MYDFSCGLLLGKKPCFEPSLSAMPFVVLISGVTCPPNRPQRQFDFHKASKISVVNRTASLARDRIFGKTWQDFSGVACWEPRNTKHARHASLSRGGHTYQRVRAPSPEVPPPIVFMIFLQTLDAVFIKECAQVAVVVIFGRAAESRAA